MADDMTGGYGSTEKSVNVTPAQLGIVVVVVLVVLFFWRRKRRRS
ncbi:MAG: hypothetical protein WB239_07645 [Acidimicrobiia bacterium]